MFIKIILEYNSLVCKEILIKIKKEIIKFSNKTKIENIRIPSDILYFFAKSDLNSLGLVCRDYARQIAW